VTRILYSGTKNASSWAMRAWLALKEADVEFEERVVDIRRPQRFENLARVGEFSPPAAVPVLVDDGTVIFDSLAIMEYANELGGGRVVAGAARRRARARSLLAWQHSGLSNICARLSFESVFYPERRAMTSDEQAECSRLFRVWEDELANSRGPYLTGELALPDLAFVPAVLRLLAHAPEIDAWPLARAWCDRLIARARVQEWLRDGTPLPPVGMDEYAA
jgi:glutathione S-transferase